MIIREAKTRDMELVCALEKRIEGKNAATKQTLGSRRKMFPQGFLVAEENGKIKGYIESCLWNKKRFERFEEIRDFPRHHRKNGKTMHVIFLAVGKEARRKGIGSLLVKALQNKAEKKGIEQIRLVAGKGFLKSFYKKLGFKTIKKLPDFLPCCSGTLMEKKTLMHSDR